MTNQTAQQLAHTGVFARINLTESQIANTVVEWPRILSHLPRGSSLLADTRNLSLLAESETEQRGMSNDDLQTLA